ncbi:enoyl-CoA hydratase/isomerase family protein [Alcanivorax sp. 1008]|uniref:enoyl-CoA hydratase/isomerase family protein n=1 Tax=Alcanivorax sp. 1008 TaxID=2816853 RepID=UPI001D7878C8|nr:enoyl-CoA hydratase/isomerase family protein [Alcanivorax sp. 1008]MCC1495594.1 enoyl-CoA hydratase/isomerase family protein [Alcanivorax sp. 1008]
MHQPVLFRTESTQSGKKIGFATLNVPKALNSLSLEMIDLLYAQLTEWQQDDTIAAVWLDAEGEKAFCAGGDIVRLYQSMVDTPKGQRNQYAEDFFAREYRLDYLLHTFAKPVICWGHGIVMGGGLGLMSGCSHRVVTEKSRIAMPEITIGLHPDVGGSWFLSRMPGRLGLFLGLTGANINAADALFVGLADRAISHQQKKAVIAELCNCAQLGHAAVSSVLRRQQMAADTLPGSALRDHFDQINNLCDADSLAQLHSQITGYQADDPLLQKAAATLAKGCVQTAWLVWESQRRVRQMSLAEAFRMEWSMSVQCALHDDFREGVRALLIDKDGSPAFRYSKVEDFPEQLLNEFFVSPVVPHPLEAL